LRLVLQLGNLLASESYQCHKSLHFFDSFEECLELSVVICHGLISLSQCCQVMCRVIHCSREVVIMCQPLQYCQPLCQFVLDCSIKPISYNQFCVFDEGFIMALLRWICSYQLQIIIQESSLETTPVPKSLHASMASFFVFDHGLTSLALR